jgi:hypothetical protein
MRFANRTFCLCRVVNNDGAWFHTVPKLGEYPGGNVCHNGEPVKNAVIVIDREAYDRMLSAFKSEKDREGFHGLLVDREHFSLDSDKPSDAMAWAKDIREDFDGLWTRWDFTPPGQTAWDDKVLVSRSPVMILERIAGHRFRPVALESIAMTNTPHFDLSTIAAARAAEEQGTAAPDAAQKQGDPTMKKLLALLGLPETATEEEAVAAAQVIIDRASAADAEMKKAQAACRKAACDAFISANKARITDEAKFREAYEKSPEATEAAFGLFKADAPAHSPTRISARDAQTPGDAAPVTLAAYRAMPAGKEKDAFLARHGETLLRLERAETK